MSEGAAPPQEGPEPASGTRDGEPASGVASGLSDAVALGVFTILSAALSILSIRVTLKATSHASYAQYQAFLVVANFSIILCNWPAWSVLRLGAEEVLEHRRLSRTAALHLCLLAASLAVVTPLLFLARGPLAAFILAPVLPLVVGYAATAALGQVLAAHLKPAGRVAVFGALPVLTRGLQLAALLLWLQPFLARDLALVTTITAAPQVLIVLILLAPRLRGPIAQRPGDASRALSFGGPIVLRNLAIATLQSVSFVFIRVSLDETDAARYQVAAQVAEQVAVLGLIVEHLVGPILARAAARGDESTLGAYFRVLAPQVVLFWSIGTACLILAARPILAVLGAHDVEPSARVLEVLLIATTLRIVGTLEAPVLDAHLDSRAPAVAFVVRLATNLLLARLLVVGGGITGVAWATVAAAASGGLVQSLFVARRFRLPSLRAYAGVAPALAALAWAHSQGGRGVLRDAGAAVAIAAVALVLARASGLLSRDTPDVLRGVRMPARARALLARLYGRAP